MDNYDFSGIATAYDILCGDGRIIKSGAFDHQDGEIVPIVWRHNHDDIRNILGHALLRKNEMPSGIRSFATFNNSKEGQKAKSLVENGDVDSLSIWANELIEHQMVGLAPSVTNIRGSRREVEKGRIREVSLVLKGQNPGAKIDDVVRHSEDPLDDDEIIVDGAIFHSGLTDGIELFKEKEVEETEEDLSHEEEEETEEVEETEEDLSHEEDETIGDIVKSLNETQRQALDVILVASATGENPPASSGSDKDDDSPTFEEVLETFSEKQKQVLYYLAGELTNEKESLKQGDLDMPESFNVFEEEGVGNDEAVIAHQAANNLIDTARKERRSLRELYFQSEIDGNALQHSITDVSYMFPDARAVEPGGPRFDARKMGWVKRVLDNVKPRPFSRIKSWYADLTGADARAKGWTSPNQKVEEVIAVLKRTTDPQTVYKLQKLDRDDVLDITDFNVVVWLKKEMRMMLEEEIARAILISDGRAGGHDDKIVETNIRPIYNDDDVYAVKARYNDVSNEKALSAFTSAEALVLLDYIAASVADYRGSGAPVLYCQPELVTKFLLLRDSQDRRMHDTIPSLAAALRVSDIIEVPPMSGMQRTGDVNPSGLPAGTYTIETLGIIVNLMDYVVGTDRGGETNFFDDFDIDFNKYSYLFETRMSGALVIPKSAIVIENVEAKTA